MTGGPGGFHWVSNGSAASPLGAYTGYSGAPDGNAEFCPCTSSSSAASSEAPSSEAPSSEAPSSGTASSGPHECACIPNPPAGSTGGDEAEMGRMAEVEPEFFWEEAADGNRNLRHGTPDRNNQEVYDGTTGTMTCYMPEQGTNYKKAICYLNGFTGTAAFDFPMPFTVAPWSRESRRA